jgi:hypothetical protein
LQIDLYPLFRSLSLKNILTLYESLLSESRIILRSTHPALLTSASQALTSLLYPLTYTGVQIPVLPSRLLSALDAPVSYLIGIGRYDRLELPTDDFVLVDLDQDSVFGSAAGMRIPPVLRQKLGNLLAVAAPLHLSRGVPVGPPDYIKEAFPGNCFVVPQRELLSAKRAPAEYGRFVGLRTAQFSELPVGKVEAPVFNAFRCATREEEREMEAFFYASNPGSMQSISSFSTFDSGKYGSVGSRASMQVAGNSIKGLTAHLRHPSSGSGGWANSFSRVRTICFLADDPGRIREEGVFGYEFGEWVCGVD